MTVTRQEARRMMDIAGGLISNHAFSTAELVKRVRHGMPHATPEDLAQAINARLHDLEEETYESTFEKSDCERCLRIIGRARLAGYSDMTTFQAAVLMAEKGDPESVALLKEIKDRKRGIV